MSSLWCFSTHKNVRTLELTKAKVCAQLFHVILSKAQDEPLRRSAQGSSHELLSFLCHHASTHLHILRELLQQLSRRIFWGHCQHVVHMHACANISDHINEQTWVSLVLHKTLLFQLSPEVLSSASRRCTQAWQCFPHPPHNLPPVQKILWSPPLRWLSEELLSVSHFSVEKSLRVVSHERFVLCLSSRPTMTTPFAHLELWPWLRTNPDHCEVLRSLTLSCWLSRLWASSSSPPSVQT